MYQCHPVYPKDIAGGVTNEVAGPSRFALCAAEVSSFDVQKERQPVQGDMYVVVNCDVLFAAAVFGEREL